MEQLNLHEKDTALNSLNFGPNYYSGAPFRMFLDYNLLVGTSCIGDFVCNQL